MAQTSVRLESSSIAELMTQAYEHAYDQGWTDGLPIIPATPDAVQRFIAASGRPAEEVIGIIPPRKGRAIVEVIAVNAVMAGCRPEYMPVIIAALEGLTDKGFPLEFIQVTTNPMTPFLLHQRAHPSGDWTSTLEPAAWGRVGGPMPPSGGPFG